MATKVAVYNFKKYEIATDERRIGYAKGTLSAIEFADSKPILETEEMVDVSELDGDGFYRPNLN
jgi:hypothetical protein